jgi:hypothetical protein
MEPPQDGEFIGRDEVRHAPLDATDTGFKD